MAKKKTCTEATGYRWLTDLNPDLEFVTNKVKSARAYYSYFLARCTEMFEYKNLPDTIPHEILDRYLFLRGIACITKDPNGQLRVFFGNLGGEQEVYYRPTKFIIANPHFKQTFSKECVVLGDEPHDGVLMRNDSCWIGLHPMLSRYACLLAENTLTIRVSDVLLRITSLLSAPTDKEYKSAIEYLDSIESGDLGVIADNPFFDGIKMQSPPSNNGSYLTQFIELQQYLKGSIFNELGLSANYNMKREAIGKGESTLDQDALLPLCENMLKARCEDLSLVNELFGTDISVDFSSAWKENILQAKLTLLSQSTQAGFTIQKGDDNNEEIQKGGEDASGEVSEGEGSTDPINGGDSDSSERDNSDNSDNSNGVSNLSNNPEEKGSSEENSDLSQLTDGEKGSSSDEGDQVGSTRNDLSRDVTLDKLDEILDDAIEELGVPESTPNINPNSNPVENNEIGGEEKDDTEETSESEGDISGS